MEKRVFKYNQLITVGNQAYKLVTCIVEGVRYKEITVGLIGQTGKNIWRTGRIIDNTGWKSETPSLNNTLVKIRLNNKHIYFELTTGREVKKT